MGIRNIRHGVPAALLVAAGLALAACGPTDDSGSGAGSARETSSSSQADVASSGPTTGAADTTDPSSASTPTSTSAGASAAAQPSATGKAAGSAQPACATSRLKTTAEDVTSGAGSTTFELVFRNTGKASCTLRGYPGVSFVKIHNIQLGKAAARTGGTVSAVTLKPDARAYADVRTVNGQGGYSASQCDLTTVPTLRIYPPNQTESTNIPWNTPECVGSTIQNLQVGPVHTDR